MKGRPIILGSILIISMLSACGRQTGSINDSSESVLNNSISSSSSINSSSEYTYKEDTSDERVFAWGSVSSSSVDPENTFSVKNSSEEGTESVVSSSSETPAEKLEREQKEDQIKAEEDAKKAPPTIIGSGYYIDENSIGHYAVKIQNTNELNTVDGTLHVTIKDGSGNIVDTDDTPVEYITSGETVIASGSKDCSNVDGATMEFSFDGYSLTTEYNYGYISSKNFLFKDVIYTPNETGVDGVITGKIVNKTDKNIDITKINIAFVKGDTIVGGAWGLSDAILAKKSTDFKVPVSGVGNLDYDKIEVNADAN